MNTVTKEEFEAILSTAFGDDVPEAFENIDNFKNFYRLNTKEDSKYCDIDGKIYHFDSSSLGYKKFLEDIQNNDVGIAYHDRKRGGFFGVGIILQSDYVEKTKSVLIFDEINRGNLSKIFGELIYGLEYRNEEIDLQYKEFDEGSELGTLRIPPRDKLMVIGTMNTADRSIVLFDAALRGRFLFIPLFPDYDLLAQTFELDAEFDKTKLRVDFDNAKTSNDNKNKIISLLALEKINSALTNNPSIGREKQIGHTYLLDLQDDSRLFVKIWKMEILPLLEEYYFESPDELEKMFNKKLFETRDGIKEFDEKSLRDALYEYTKPP